VELIVAVAFLLVLVAERYLPAGIFVSHTRRLLTPQDGVPFWCMYVTHIGLVTTILAAILILADGFSVPAALFLPITVVGLAFPILWPEIRSVPAFAYPDENVWWAGLIDGLAGAATAGLVASLGSWRWACYARQWPTFAPVSWSCAVGVVLGWQRTMIWLPVILILSLLAVSALRLFPQSVDNQVPEPPPRSDPDESPLPESQYSGPEIPPDELAPAPPSTNSELP
jgi:hypothetical protein